MPPGKHISVVAPHLDDGILSLGASIAAWTRAGMRVDVLTVLAGDPESTLPPRPWDAQCGFATAGEAARARRVEDAEACRIVGARPIWLPFGGLLEGRGDTDEAILNTTLDAVREADTVLLPGFPLMHEDHLWLTRLVLDGAREVEASIGVYVEQPYVCWKVFGTDWRRGLPRVVLAMLRTPWARARQSPHLDVRLPPSTETHVHWSRARASSADHRRKRRAIRSYRSQLRGFDRWVLPAIALYEWSRGGEELGWLDRMDEGDRADA